MARKNRPTSAREAMGRQEAGTRRGAPGRRFIGETAAQSASARRTERKRVERMAEIDAAEHRAGMEMPVAVIIAELLEDAYRLFRTLVAAPFRIAQALRRPREA